MDDKSFEFYTSRYGNPIFRFLTCADYDDRMFGDVPYECCVFNINHSSKVMAVSRCGSKDEWQANFGERAIINELLRRAAAHEESALKCAIALLKDGITVEKSK